MPLRSRQSLLAILVALAGLALLAGIWLGGHPQHLPSLLTGLVADKDTKVINQALDDIQRDYYRPVSRASLTDSSIAGMVARLNDRFSNYLNPQVYRDYNSDSHPQFSGVGMDVQREPRGLLVEQVYEGSPAARGKIMPGDVITAVNRRSLAGVPEAQATALIKGRPGTRVSLTIRHGAGVHVLRLTRATLTVPVVASRLRIVRGKKLADTVLATFGVPGAHGELRQAIDRQLKAGARGIVLDLRHNGGGLVEEARLVASIFLPDGTIVTTRGRTQPTETLTATGGAISAAIPVVVLVDGDTASASEIVAGALQDRHRATVVGTHTFGKGVFQEIKPLSNGGALDITVGQYFTPSGHNLGGAGVNRGAGITPDVYAKANPRTPRDEVLEKALLTLAAKVR